MTEISYFDIIAVDWPQQVLVSNVKIHVRYMYVKCEYDRASEQLASSLTPVNSSEK